MENSDWWRWTGAWAIAGLMFVGGGALIVSADKGSVIGLAATVFGGLLCSAAVALLAYAWKHIGS